MSKNISPVIYDRPICFLKRLHQPWKRDSAIVQACREAGIRNYPERSWDSYIGSLPKSVLNRACHIAFRGL